MSSRRAASDGFRRISDPPSAVSVPRSFQYVEARRAHELHAGEIKDDRLLGTEVGLDGVSQSFTGRHVDLAAHMDDRRAVNLRYFGRELLVHDPEDTGQSVVRRLRRESALCSRPFLDVGPRPHHRCSEDGRPLELMVTAAPGRSAGLADPRGQVVVSVCKACRGFVGD